MSGRDITLVYGGGDGIEQPGLELDRMWQRMPAVIREGGDDPEDFDIWQEAWWERVSDPRPAYVRVRAYPKATKASTP